MARVVAKTVAQVIAGEAVSGTREQRFDDMKAIASVIENRAKALGVTQQQVVANRREFNAYGKALPAGAAAYIGLADEALQHVDINGPIHNATFYATPAAKKNLPKGLVQETKTTGHVYFSDPKNRAIGTAIGYKQPNPAALATQVAANVPTPSFAPRNVTGGLLTAPGQPSGLMAMSPTTVAPAQAAIAAALASAPASTALSPAKEANLASRLGPAPSLGLTPAMEANLASRLGPAPAAPTRQTLNAAQEANLSQRLGVPVNSAPRNAISPAKEANVMGRLNAAEAPSPSVSIGGLLGVSPAGAAERNSTQALAAASRPAAPSTGFAGPIGSPRSMEATMGGPLAANRMSPAPSAPTQAPSPQAAPAAPQAGNMMGLAGSPRTAQQQSMASLDATNAMGAGMFTGAPAARPSAPAMSPEAALAADVADQRQSLGLPALSAPRTVASPPATYNAPANVTQPSVPSYSTPRAPQNIAGAIGQTRAPSQQPTGLGLPSVPDAPSGFAQARSRVGNYASQNAGGLLGGFLGAAALGPIGGLLGGWAGRSIQNANTTQPSPLAMALGKAGLIGGLVDNGTGQQGNMGGMGGWETATQPGGYTQIGNDGSRTTYGANGNVIGDPWGGLRNATGGSSRGGIGPGGSGARSPV